MRPRTRVILAVGLIAFTVTLAVMTLALNTFMVETGVGD